MIYISFQPPSSLCLSFILWFHANSFAFIEPTLVIFFLTLQVCWLHSSNSYHMCLHLRNGLSILFNWGDNYEPIIRVGYPHILSYHLIESWEWWDTLDHSKFMAKCRKISFFFNLKIWFYFNYLKKKGFWIFFWK